MATTTLLRFELPANRLASAPPESRGLARDEVRLMIASQREPTDTVFRHIADHLTPGDLLVLNTSPTMPAALVGTMHSGRVGIHLSTRHDDGTWTVELRRMDRSGPILDGSADAVVEVQEGGSARLLRPSDGTGLGSVRLWRAALDLPGGVRDFVMQYGVPIRYGYVDAEWPLAAYQTIFADPTSWPGSAEMPSAGRPFSPRVVADLHRRQVGVASIRLDAGVSSPEAHELPQPERFVVPQATADLVNRTRVAGGRVVAVGTTVTRALESAAEEDGTVTGGRGWTDLVLGPARPARVVGGLVTGWHPPEASHLQLLEAVAGRELIATAYQRALASAYLWHEFGDAALLLPHRYAGACLRAA